MKRLIIVILFKGNLFFRRVIRSLDSQAHELTEKRKG